MNQKEIPLQGGESTDTVVRIGNTVRRSIGKNAQLVHALLQDLENANYRYAPRYLGMDEKGREILSYIEGDVPRGISFSMEQLIACAKMLRAFHDAASLSDLCGQEETICHSDFAPWNLIFHHSVPVGIIDFDDCRPGKRIEDVAYFLWTFLDLGNPEIDTAEQLKKMTALCESYQLDPTQNLSEALLTQQERILVFRQAIVLNETNVEKRVFSAGAVKRIQDAIEWVKLNGEKINKRKCYNL